jgi:hypothetical protein
MTASRGSYQNVRRGISPPLGLLADRRMLTAFIDLGNHSIISKVTTFAYELRSRKQSSQFRVQIIWSLRCDIRIGRKI